MNAILPAFFTATPFFIAMVLGLLLPLLALQMHRHFAVGLFIVALSFLIDTYYQRTVGIELGLKLYTADFALVLVGAIGGLRWLVARDQPRRQWAWLLFAGVFFIDLALGLAKSGSAAGVSARGDFYSLAAATYAMSFPVGQRHVRALVNALVWIAVLMLALCVYRWIVYYTPIRDLLPAGGNYNVDGPIRVVGSYDALAIAQALLVGIFFASIGKGAWVARLLAPLLLGGVVVLQHRSVWLASMVGVLVSLLLARQQQASRLQQLVLLSTIGLLTALALVLGDSGSQLTGQLSRSAGTALAGTGTVDARAQNWRATLGEWAGGGPRAIVFGLGFGAQTDRYMVTEAGERRKITFGAHNNYVSILSQMGIVGFAAWLVALAIVMRGLARLCLRGEGGGEAGVLFMLMCMQLVYYVAYGTDYLQFLIFGVAAAYVAQHQCAAQPRAQKAAPRHAPAFAPTAWMPRSPP